MKKVLIFVDSMSPSGGIERVIANLSNNWVDNYDITIVVKDETPSFYDLDSRINIKTLRNKLTLNMNSRIDRVFQLFKNLFSNYSSLKKVLRTENPDFVYVANPYNLLEIYLQKNFIRKTVVTEHGSAFAFNFVYKTIKRLLYKKALIIISPNKMDTEHYKSQGFNARYIPHLNTFKVVSQSNHEPKKTVLNIGRFTEDKQQLKLLDIWCNVIKEIDDNEWMLQIIGSGELENELKNYANKLDISNRVIFIPPQKDISSYFNSTSIFVFTSKMEGFGMVLLEAMCFGIPCVSFDCPSGPRDIVKNNLNGFLIEDGNVSEFSIKLVNLIKDRTLRSNFSVNALEFAKNWDNQSILEEWKEIFSDKE